MHLLGHEVNDEDATSEMRYNYPRTKEKGRTVFFLIRLGVVYSIPARLGHAKGGGEWTWGTCSS